MSTEGAVPEADEPTEVTLEIQDIVTRTSSPVVPQPSEPEE